MLARHSSSRAPTRISRPTTIRAPRHSRARLNQDHLPSFSTHASHRSALYSLLVLWRFWSLTFPADLRAMLCYECLSQNPSLWMITYPDARRAFDLSAASVNRLPTLHSIPGEYSIRWTVKSKRPIRLVSARAVGELALEQGKSAAYPKHHLENQQLSLRSRDKLSYLLKTLLQAPGSGFVPLQRTPVNVVKVPDLPNDSFCGMASVPFPYLSAGRRVENGLWCLGCDKTWRERWGRGLYSNTLNAIAHVARTEIEFSST